MLFELLPPAEQFHELASPGFGLQLLLELPALATFGLLKAFKLVDLALNRSRPTLVLLGELQIRRRSCQFVLLKFSDLRLLARPAVPFCPLKVLVKRFQDLSGIRNQAQPGHFTEEHPFDVTLIVLGNPFQADQIFEA